MKLFDRLRRKPHDQPVGSVMTVVQDSDEERPTTCECGAPATRWVDYLWRKMNRGSFDVGHTTEDICETHFKELLDNKDVNVQDWGEL